MNGRPLALGCQGYHFPPGPRQNERQYSIGLRCVRSAGGQSCVGIPQHVGALGLGQFPSLFLVFILLDISVFIFLIRLF